MLHICCCNFFSSLRQDNIPEDKIELVAKPAKNTTSRKNPKVYLEIPIMEAKPLSLQDYVYSWPKNMERKEVLDEVHKILEDKDAGTYLVRTSTELGAIVVHIKDYDLSLTEKPKYRANLYKYRYNGQEWINVDPENDVQSANNSDTDLSTSLNNEDAWKKLQEAVQKCFEDKTNKFFQENKNIDVKYKILETNILKPPKNLRLEPEAKPKAPVKSPYSPISKLSRN